MLAAARMCSASIPLTRICADIGGIDCGSLPIAPIAHAAVLATSISNIPVKVHSNILYIYFIGCPLGRKSPLRFQEPEAESPPVFCRTPLWCFSIVHAQVTALVGTLHPLSSPGRQPAAGTSRASTPHQGSGSRGMSSVQRPVDFIAR